jgi:hypothetical protein
LGIETIIHLQILEANDLMNAERKGKIPLSIFRSSILQGLTLV